MNEPLAESKPVVLEAPARSIPVATANGQAAAPVWLERIGSAIPRNEPSRWDDFQSARTVGDALQAWFGAAAIGDRRETSLRLSQAIASIDRLLNDQLNVILHAPAFQRLESSWRGLRHLTDRVEAEGATNVRVRVLNVSWRELERDFERASEFDQSQAFKKIYEEEFGMPGGQPFGVMLADFEVRAVPTTSHPYDDFSLLASLSRVAAAAFCPLLLGAHPAMFGLDDFDSLERRLDHATTFEHLDYLKWRALRDSPDSRFLGLLLPRALMRAPHLDDGSRTDRFCFREDVEGPDRSRYLWGSPTYAMGGVMIRAFAQAGWLANIRGVRQDWDGGGLVADLPLNHFNTDRPGVVSRFSTEVAIPDELERQLADLGFIALCDCQDTPYAAFFSAPSIQKPKKHSQASATANAKISAMLQHILCASRFAHYLKVIARDKIGSFSEASELERHLHDWIVRYVTLNDEGTDDTKARFPLREADVSVRTLPGKPGAYYCVMHLSPHYELDDLSAAIRLETELAPPRLP